MHRLWCGQGNSKVQSQRSNRIADAGFAALTSVRDLAAEDARVLLLIVRPPQSGARGVVKYAHQYSQRRHRKHPAFPTQWFYGLYVISPGTGLFCPRHLADHDPRNLTPASGCQDDFAVRLGAVRYRRLRVHRIPPRPANVTIACRPSVGTVESITLALPSCQEKFLKSRKQSSLPAGTRSNSPRPANCALRNAAKSSFLDGTTVACRASPRRVRTRIGRRSIRRRADFE